MALSEIEHTKLTKRLSAYCDARVPIHVRDKIRLGFRIRNNEVVLFEERPAFQPPHDWRESPVARFKYIGTQRVWRLFCQHRDLRWHEYQRRPSARTFDALLNEVERDPTGIFWG